MLSKAFYFIISFIFVMSSGKSQMKTEIGLLLGQSYYLGDLNPTTQFPGGHTHISWGITIRQPINERWAFKAQYFNSKLSGSDASSNSTSAINRNLSFETPLNEFSGQFEFNFARYHSFIIRHHFSPYLFGGLGLGFINPRTEFNGNQYDLRELRTEGQDKPYSKAQIVIPFGFGLKFKFSHRLMFGLEYGIRRTFTDYIDDVSTAYPNDPNKLTTTAQALSNRNTNNKNRSIWGTQRGNPNKNDFYTHTSFTVTVRLGKQPNLCRYNTQ
ncbi:MAG: DUF6089 family protein [Salibacteraceae bacterium]|nr:DUF6089 family protein [Salibacteraceae bacterium]